MKMLQHLLEMSMSTNQAVIGFSTYYDADDDTLTWLIGTEAEVLVKTVNELVTDDYNKSQLAQQLKLDENDPELEQKLRAKFASKKTLKSLANYLSGLDCVAIVPKFKK